MSVTLRTPDLDTDLARIVELANLIMSEPITPENLMEWEANRPEGELRHRLVAIDDPDRIIGFAAGGRAPWRTPGEFGIEVVVDPAARNRGVGTRLYEAVHAFAQENGATCLKTQVRERHVEALQFAQRRGFEIERHIFESTLEIAAFDARRFAGTIEAVEATGIRFFSFAELQGTLEDQRALYDLNTITARDIPGSDPKEARPFEQFRKDVFEAFWFRPDGQIIAADGDRWVGLVAVGEIRPGVMYNMMTGVLREYRGRKIALALKLLGIEFCRRHGATYARTNNDSLNAPMLAINRKLGYKPEPGFYVLKQAIADREPAG